MKSPGRIIGLILLTIFTTAVVIKLKQNSVPKSQRREQNLNVIVETPRIATVSNQLHFTGDVQPNRKVGIYARVSGTLERNLVQVGDRVSSGQLLAQIDTTELTQTVLLTSAAYKNSRAVFERSRELAAKNLISAQEFDLAKASMEASQANYESARLRLGYASITAPFSGVITERFFDAGALINANNAILFTLVDMETVKVTVDVLERDVPKIERGAKAILTVDAYPEKSFEGILKRISEAVDPKTRTMAVEIDVPNPDRMLKPGMFGEVNIILDVHPEALTVPSKILLKSGNGEYLWLARNGKSVRQPVTTGWIENDRTEILSGIGITDSIITVGFHSLHEGGKINISQR